MKYTCVVGKMREINSIADKYFTQRIKEANLPILENHIALFYVLPENGEPKLYNEICIEWGISKSSISDIINKYVKLGCVIKYPCKEDKRTVYVAMTEEGIKIKKELNTIEQDLLELLFTDFDLQQRELFDKRVDHVLKNSNHI